MLQHGMSKGFGFVSFGSKKEADSAMFHLNMQNLEGKLVHVSHTKGEMTTGVSETADSKKIVAIHDDATQAEPVSKPLSWKTVNNARLLCVRLAALCSD